MFHMPRNVTSVTDPRIHAKTRRAATAFSLDIWESSMSLDCSQIFSLEPIRWQQWIWRSTNNIRHHQDLQAQQDQVRQNWEEAPENRRSTETKDQEVKCFFYGEVAGSVGLHEAAIFQLGPHVRLCSLILDGMDLLTKLNARDMVTQEGKYHRNYLLNLYNCARKMKEMAGKGGGVYWRISYEYRPRRLRSSNLLNWRNYSSQGWNSWVSSMTAGCTRPVLSRNCLITACAHFRKWPRGGRLQIQICI